MTTPQNTKLQAFTFGDPEPIIQGRDLSDLFKTYWNGEYYEPPVNLNSLAQLMKANTHHESAIRVKANTLASCYKKNKLLSNMAFKRVALDYVIFGNAYLQSVRNRWGKIIALDHVPAKHMRIGKGDYTFLPSYDQKYKIAGEDVFHFSSPDVNQEIYGIPEYLSAIQSILLNEAATLFRRKYYINGSHAGYILHITDAGFSDEDAEGLEKALQGSKGLGNFKNLLLHTPNGKPDGVKLIPISEVMAKDEFKNIKSITQQDIATAHRVPLELMSIRPENTGGLANPAQAAAVFNRMEIIPLQATFEDANHWTGQTTFAFDPFTIPKTE